jgi:hypothetical protein
LQKQGLIAMEKTNKILAFFSCCQSLIHIGFLLLTSTSVFKMASVAWWKQQQFQP